MRAPGKVLFFSETQGWSGGAKQLLDLAQGLKGYGWGMLLACPADGEAYRRAGPLGIETIDIHPREDYDIISAFRLAHLVSERAVDIVHAHHPRAHAVGLIASYLCRRPFRFIVSRRVSFSIKRNPFSRFKYRSSRIDRFIAVADSIREGLIDAGVDPSKVVTIPSGVDLQIFSPRPKDEILARELELPPGAAVIGVIANYGSWKGQDIVLEAAGRLRERGRKAVFLFAGRDTQDPRLKAKAQARGIPAAELRFLGFRDDVPRVLSLLDVSVNAASSGEGLSGALRESLAMGIPVVASDAGGNGELVQDGVTGRLVPAGDGGALAEALEQVLGNLGAARAMAESGRRLVREKFSRERMWEKTDGLYRALLSPGSAQRPKSLA